MHTVSVNPHVLRMEYAVRGPIPQRAAEMQAQGRSTIPCNIGNPQALGQQPISYYRQVLSLVEDPMRLERERATGSVPADVLDEATAILERARTGAGAYTESAGFRFVREAVARFIDARDQAEPGSARAADPDAIFLTDGASGGAAYVLEALIRGPEDGILIPIPQYPLYSATIARCGGTQVSYYPDEDRGWTVSRDAILEPLEAAERAGVQVKAIVVINPGNPTGAILDETSMQQVVELAREHGLAIIADEVYQENTYGHDWVSFASILGDARDVPLLSLHSVSKGFYGECGHRGGYLELRNPARVEGTDLSFTDVILKQASVNLCPNTVGQILTYLMVSGPREATGTRRIYEQERQQVLDDLHAKATLIRSFFSEMSGVECFGRIGAMYLFPRLGPLPAGTGDFEYCMRLLEETGLCTVNGAGFGQRQGTHHLRIAFLPPRQLIQEVMPRWVEFHNRYVGA